MERRRVSPSYRRRELLRQDEEGRRDCLVAFTRCDPIYYPPPPCLPSLLILQVLSCMSCGVWEVRSLPFRDRCHAHLVFSGYTRRHPGVVVVVLLLCLCWRCAAADTEGGGGSTAGAGGGAARLGVAGDLGFIHVVVAPRVRDHNTILCDAIL